jgi:hypothetical protein
MTTVTEDMVERVAEKVIEGLRQRRVFRHAFDMIDEADMAEVRANIGYAALTALTPPTQAMVEAGARAACIADGFDPDDGTHGRSNWKVYVKHATATFPTMLTAAMEGGKGGVKG